MSEHEADFAAMAATGDEHKKLEPFVGTFKSKVSMWMGPGDPQISTGTMVSEWDLGGRFLKQTYSGDPNEGPFPSFEGRGYMGYNTSSKQYEGMWIDNASTIIQMETGHVDESGKVWTMVGEMPHPMAPGQTMAKRSVITVVDEDHHRMEMYFDSGDGEAKSMEIEYHRA